MENGTNRINGLKQTVSVEKDNIIKDFEGFLRKIAPDAETIKNKVQKFREENGDMEVKQPNYVLSLKFGDQNITGVFYLKINTDEDTTVKIENDEA